MKSLNFPARFIELATEINGHMPEHVADRVTDLLNEDRLAVNGARILVLGVAYKANVSDMRESPALDVIRLLAAKGAEVCYHDPHVREIAARGHELQERRPQRRRALALATSSSIITDHADVDYARVVAKAHRIFDTRNAMRDVKHGPREDPQALGACDRVRPARRQFTDLTMMTHSAILPAWPAPIPFMKRKQS